MSVVPEIFVSRMLEKTVVDSGGRRIGKVVEVYADTSHELPRVAGLGVNYEAGATRMIPWESVQAMVREYFYVQHPRAAFQESHPKAGLLRLHKDVLDKQIVDLDGLKVVRVNDLKLADVQGHLTLIAADVGFRGLLRRLGLRGLVHYWEARFSREVSSTLLDWKGMEVIDTGESSSPSRLRLSVPSERLKRLHPADLADIVEELNARERAAVFAALDPESAADLLQEVEPEVQSRILDELSEETAWDIIEALPADEAADILGELSQDRAEQLLSALDEDDANEVRELMDYDEETAGSLMATDYIALPKELTADEAIQRLREMQPEEEVAYYLYAVDSVGRLEGVVSLRRIVISSPSARLEEIMDTNVVSVLDTDDEDEVAEILDKYGLLAVPVVDEDNVLVGSALLSDVVSEVYRPHRRKGLLF